MAQKVAIITVLYNNVGDIPGYFSSISKIRYPAESLRLIIYDNYSNDGSFELANSFAADSLFHVEVVQATENTGFTGGNNRAWRLLADEAYVFLLNPDTEVDPDCIEKLVAACEADSLLGAAQPLILTLPDREKVNTTGNIAHYVGFGMVKDNGRLRGELDIREPQEIVSVSGAAFFIRRAVLGVHEDPFVEDFFAYHEDFELSWRLRLRGWKLKMIPDAVIYHRYAFGKGTYKYFLLEKNRAAVLFTHYSAKTLLLLAPFILFTEAVVFAQSVLEGWVREKIRGWIATMQNVPKLIVRRRLIQEARVVKDGEIIRNMHDVLVFPEVTPLPVRYIYNPLSMLYRRLLLLVF